MFDGEGKVLFLATWLNHQHIKVRRMLGLPEIS
jgi:hypothetical protein